jgi:hypothetical protein
MPTYRVRPETAQSAPAPTCKRLNHLIIANPNAQGINQAHPVHTNQAMQALQHFSALLRVLRTHITTPFVGLWASFAR